MRQILVKIDTNDVELCENCQSLGYVDLCGTGKFEDPSCGVFNEDLGRSELPGRAYRCRTCIDADNANLRCNHCGSVRGNFYAEECNKPVARWYCKDCLKTTTFTQNGPL
jgi:hypothetical protein